MSGASESTVNRRESLRRLLKAAAKRLRPGGTRAGSVACGGQGRQKIRGFRDGLQGDARGAAAKPRLW